jgi:hypothetical protein
MIILSFDVGIVNLAFSKSYVDDETWKLTQVLEARCVDITRLEHQRVAPEFCKLFHSNHIYDRLQHFFQEFQDIFCGCDHVLVEKQPPQGICSVEQLLFGHFRDRVHFVRPQEMHRFFHIQHLVYEDRKRATIQVAKPYLATICKAQDNDHIADSICLTLYWIHQSKPDPSPPPPSPSRPPVSSLPLPLRLPVLSLPCPRFPNLPSKQKQKQNLPMCSDSNVICSDPSFLGSFFDQFRYIKKS